jgi:hypothetical protein
MCWNGCGLSSFADAVHSVFFFCMRDWVETVCAEEERSYWCLLWFVAGSSCLMLGIHSWIELLLDTDRRNKNTLWWSRRGWYHGNKANGFDQPFCQSACQTWTFPGMRQNGNGTFHLSSLTSLCLLKAWWLSRRHIVSRSWRIACILLHVNTWILLCKYLVPVLESHARTVEYISYTVILL